MINFSGSSIHKLDSKNRVSVPSQYRKWSDDEQCTFVISIGLDPCLVIRPAQEYDIYVKKLTLKLSSSSRKHRAYIRKISEGATRVTCDKQGRLLIPQILMEKAKLKEKVQIIGNVNTIEIWNIDAYKHFDLTNVSLDDEIFDEVNLYLENS